MDIRTDDITKITVLEFKTNIIIFETYTTLDILSSVRKVNFLREYIEYYF